MRVREATRNALEGERARQETAEALARTEARLAAIIESSDDAIVGKTLDGIVTNWNLGAERLFGYAALERIRQGKRVEHFETERIRKDGQRIHVSLTVSPIKDSNDRIIGASKIARDVSDRKRIEQERERLLENAERALAEGKRPAAPRTPSSLPSRTSSARRFPRSWPGRSCCVRERSTPRRRSELSRPSSGARGSRRSSSRTKPVDAAELLALVATLAGARRTDDASAAARDAGRMVPR